MIDSSDTGIPRHFRHFVNGIATRLGATTFAISSARRHERPLLIWLALRLA